MKTLKILFAVTAVIALSTTSAKAGFVWNGAAGAPAPGTKLHISIKNFEYGVNVDGVDSLGAPSAGGMGGIVALVDSVGDEIRGIFIVDSIFDFDNPGQVFWTPTATAELAGYFDSYFVSSFLLPTAPSTTAEVNFIGGVQKIFFDDTPDFLSDFSLGGDGVGIGHGSGFANDGTLFLDMLGEGGILAASPLVTLATTINLGSLPLPTGSGFGFLDIIGGTGEVLFVPDGADPFGPGVTTGLQDLRLANTIDVESGFPGTVTDWPVTSADPITGIATPEPTSLTLLGIGGLLAGAFYRRKRKTSVVSS